MDILSEVKSLDLPKDQFVVLGSGILAVKGIRQCEDIDLLVTPEIFDMLQAKGWAFDIVDVRGGKRERLVNGVWEIYKRFWQGETVEDFLQHPEWVERIEGVMFMSLSELLNIKRQWKREKDETDVKLIEEYLSRQPEA